MLNSQPRRKTRLKAVLRVARCMDFFHEIEGRGWGGRRIGFLFFLFWASNFRRAANNWGKFARQFFAAGKKAVGGFFGYGGYP
jgi:hypothetical protein